MPSFPAARLHSVAREDGKIQVEIWAGPQRIVEFQIDPENADSIGLGIIRSAFKARTFVSPGLELCGLICTTGEMTTCYCTEPAGHGTIHNCTKGHTWDIDPGISTHGHRVTDQTRSADHDDG